MHDTAAAFGAAFFRCYTDKIEAARILEVGAGDVNGTLRGCAPFGSTYTGIDLASGPGVDVVLNDPHAFPFDGASFDAVVSSSCLEHDPMFWLSFAEMCRVVREGGFVYLNAPSNGKFHRHPTDNWRFYPDAGLALAAWGRRNGHDIHLVESFVGRRREVFWNDCVMVFGKGKTTRPLRLLAELFPRSFNIRIGEDESFENFCEPTEDMTLQVWLTEKLALPMPNGNGKQASPLEELIAVLAEREAAIDGRERAASESRAQDEAQIVALRQEIAKRDEALGAAEQTSAAMREELARSEQNAAEAAAKLGAAEAALAATQAEIGERHGALAKTNRRNSELEAALAEATSRQAELAAALAAAEVGLAAARDELDQAAHTAAQYQEIADAAQSAVDALQARLAETERETAQRKAAHDRLWAEHDRMRDQREQAQREHDRVCEERDRIAQERRRVGEHRDRLRGERNRVCEQRDQIAEERDRIQEERDRLAEQGQLWFDAAILATAERLVGKRARGGWRLGRYVLQVSPSRGRGSPMNRADQARNERRWECAARFYLDALEQLGAGRPAIWVQLAHSLKEAGKIAEAEFAYRRAIDFDKDHVDALVPLGQLLRRQGRDDEAARTYLRALELAPAGELAFLSGELAALGYRAEPRPVA
jgi:SAM-dependent methyltransferase